MRPVDRSLAPPQFLCLPQSAKHPRVNHLFSGDDLQVLRDQLANESVDFSAGFYESVTGKKYPRVQLLTIEGLLSGKPRAEHPDHAPDWNFKKAKTESNAAQKELI
jgi:hypothetical protein